MKESGASLTFRLNVTASANIDSWGIAWTLSSVDTPDETGEMEEVWSCSLSAAIDSSDSFFIAIKLRSLLVRGCGAAKLLEDKLKETAFLLHGGAQFFVIGWLGFRQWFA